MLKKDFDGYLEFVQKVQKADNEEKKKLYKERTQLYVDKIQDALEVTPRGGGSGLYYHSTEDDNRSYAEARARGGTHGTETVRRYELHKQIRHVQREYDRSGCQSIRRHTEKKIKSSCTGIHEPGFRHLRQLQYNKYNTRAAECQFRQE